MPGTEDSVTRFSVAMAVRKSSADSTDTIARASFGPTPVAVCTSSNISRPESSANPYRVSESSRTTSDVARVAS